MTSIRSLAFFNGDPCVVMWLVGTATVTTQGLTATCDTTNEEWGLLSGQNRGPQPGHQRGLFHGHGHLLVRTKCGLDSRSRTCSVRDDDTKTLAIRPSRLPGPRPATCDGMAGGLLRALREGPCRGGVTVRLRERV